MLNITAILKGAMDYADEDTDGIKEFCEENNIPEEVCEAAEHQAMVESAMAAGIPMSVILGKKKLTDYYTQEYIDLQKRVQKENAEFFRAPAPHGDCAIFE